MGSPRAASTAPCGLITAIHIHWNFISHQVKMIVTGDFGFVMDSRCVNDGTLPWQILFPGEEIYYVIGKVNFRNTRYSSATNPHWYDLSKGQRAQRVVRDMKTESFVPSLTGWGQVKRTWTHCRRKHFQACWTRLANMPEIVSAWWRPSELCAYSVTLSWHSFPNIGLEIRGQVEWRSRSSNLSLLDLICGTTWIRASISILKNARCARVSANFCKCDPQSTEGGE